MKRVVSLSLSLVPLAFSVCGGVLGDEPHVGYVYPAGGRRGATFAVLLGGKHFANAEAVVVSGQGIEAEIGDHVRPLNQGQFKELQNRMGELRENMEESEGSGRRRGRKRRTGGGENTTEAGAELAALRQRLSLFAVRRFSAPALVETVELRVTIAPDATVGDRELRLLTESGLSNPVVFQVGRVPEVTEESGRSMALAASQKRGGRGRKKQAKSRPDPGTSPVLPDRREPVPIAMPCLVNGQLLPGDVDRYRIRARQGQRLVVAVRAQQLIPYVSDAVPGWLQAVVSLSDSHGREVAFADDFRHLPDPVLCYQIPVDGEYVIEVRDALYRGREDFVYRMAIGELPFVTDVFPLGWRAGEKARLSLRGWNLPASTFTVPALRPGLHAIPMPSYGLQSPAVPFSVGSLPECLETEKQASMHVHLPVVVNGRIDHPGDIDTFLFRSKAGTRVSIEVEARRLGSPLDAKVRLSDASGRQLAFNDDCEEGPGRRIFFREAGHITHHADSRIRATLPEDGIYRVQLADAQGHGGRGSAYRLRIGAEQPDFELLVVPSTINARAGATVPFTVHVLRRDGFASEIDLGLANAPRGFRLSGGRIPRGVDSVSLTLTVPADGGGVFRNLRLLGRAMVCGERVVRQARPADNVMQAFLNRHLVPAREWCVAVVEGRRRSMPRLLGPATVRLSVGTEACLRVASSSHSRFGIVQYELMNPPDGIRIGSGDEGRASDRITVLCDATADVGLRGNLIVNVFAQKAGKAGTKGKEQRKKRRILLGTLPAIPFAVVEE